MINLIRLHPLSNVLLSSDQHFTSPPAPFIKGEILLNSISDFYTRRMTFRRVNPTVLRNQYKVALQPV